MKTTPAKASSNGIFRAHRRALMKRLPDGLIVLSGGNEVRRNQDVNFVFRQDSHFLWLTGVEEPGCHLLLDPRTGVEILFVRQIDNHHRIWEGHVPGPTEARRLFGVDQVRYAGELPGLLKTAARKGRRVYADVRTLKNLEEPLKAAKKDPEELEEAFSELRAVKDAGEVALLKKASEISAAAHRACMASARPGMREYEVQAVFDSHCARSGLKHLGYPSIVAAGRNASVLHYRRNDAVIRKGELLLIDAGGEFRGYGADITRTFPVGRRFSGRQRDVYSIVLEAQKQCIDRARPGVISSELHVHSMRVLAEGLRSLGVLKGDADGLVQGGAVRLFYPHGIGHMLGLDVHDCLGGKKRALANPTGVPVRFNARLEPGFVITVEPGIYFIAALLRDRELRSKHRGSIDFARAESFLDLGGVRIEDDVVIREEGPPLNLTRVPKEIGDVEAACGA